MSKAAIRVDQCLVFLRDVHVRLQDRSDQLDGAMDMRLNALKLLGWRFFPVNPTPADDQPLEYLPAVARHSRPDVDQHGIDREHGRLEQGRVCGRERRGQDVREQGYDMLSPAVVSTNTTHQNKV